MSSFCLLKPTTFEFLLPREERLLRDREKKEKFQKFPNEAMCSPSTNSCSTPQGNIQIQSSPAKHDRSHSAKLLDADKEPF